MTPIESVRFFQYIVGLQVIVGLASILLWIIAASHLKTWKYIYTFWFQIPISIVASVLFVNTIGWSSMTGREVKVAVGGLLLPWLCFPILFEFDLLSALFRYYRRPAAVKLHRALHPFFWIYVTFSSLMLAVVFYYVAIAVAAYESIQNCQFKGALSRDKR